MSITTIVAPVVVSISREIKIPNMELITLIILENIITIL